MKLNAVSHKPAVSHQNVSKAAVSHQAVSHKPAAPKQVKGTIAHA